ncbi:hypothetical protein ACMHYO_11625 [Allopusillimonas ginsengisoli]
MKELVEAIIFSGFGFLAGYVKGVGVGRRAAEAAHAAIWKAARKAKER